MSDADPIPPLIPADALRQALGRFVTGVTIVTCAEPDGTRFGLTVNSFNSLSLDPPLVLWALRMASPSLQAFRASSHFAVNVLAEEQLDLSRRFASPHADRFGQGQWRPGLGQAPVLAGSLAVFECAVQNIMPVGDHVLFVGRVLRLVQRAGAPLLFAGGQYRSLGGQVSVHERETARGTLR